MAKALHGTTTMASQLELLDQIRSLRQRVAELESALARAERMAAGRHDAAAAGAGVDVPESADAAEVDSPATRGSAATVGA